MSKRSTSRKNRVHYKRVWLDDDELWQFNLAQKSSRLGVSDFIRQRCLHIVKHKRVEVGQIQLYQELGVLQQQCEQILDQMQQSLSTGVCAVGVGNGDGGESKSGGGAEGAGAKSTVHLLEQHLGSIKQLRQRLVKLDSGDSSRDAGNDGNDLDGDG